MEQERETIESDSFELSAGSNRFAGGRKAGAAAGARVYSWEHAVEQNGLFETVPGACASCRFTQTGRSRL